jgi:uncharacterized protein involved in exopolysaccharide biosynthesis
MPDRARPWATSAEQDLANSEKVLRTAKRQKVQKQSDDKRERDNAKRVLKTVKQDVEPVEARRDNVEKQVGKADGRGRAK